MAKPAALNPAREIPLDPDPARSYVLPARYYVDPDIYEQEKEAIFYRSWNFAGHTSRVRAPGSYFTVNIHEQEVIVMRGDDGELRGFYNVCQHRGHHLLKGEGKAKAIVCPYHGWSYETNGNLRYARATQDLPDFNPCEFALKQVQVEEFASFVFVNLDSDAPSLSSQTGDLENEIRGYSPNLEKLKFAHRCQYAPKANWKNLVDNFLECYHCKIAHPAFADLVALPTYRSKTYDTYSSHIATEAGPGNNSAYNYERRDGEMGFIGWWLWPNVTINVLPGSDNALVLHIIPDGPELSIEYIDFYFLNDEPDAQQRDAIEYLDKVLQVEDIGLCESVQRGFHSKGFKQSRYVVDKERSELSEHSLHHFHQLYLDRLAP